MTAASAVTVNGYACSRAVVQIPAWGVWWVDVDLVDAVELAGAVELAALDVALACAVVSGGVANGAAAYRLVGGVGGWRRELAARPYANDAGVRASVVLGDAARAVGETLEGAPSTNLGTHYARASGLASAVLHALAPRSWYVGLDGVTRFGARAEAEYAGDAPRVRLDPGVGVVELAVDDSLAALVPGVTVDGSEPATDVEWSLDGGRLTARVYAGTRLPRRLEAFRRLVEALDPRRRYRGATEYRVVTQDGERLNLQAVRAASGMPDLSRVPVRLAPGIRAEHTPGSFVLVAFADADPARPFVFAGDAAGAPGWTPTTLSLMAASDLVALAGLVDAQLAALASAFDAWVPAPPDGGAALKTQLTTLRVGPPVWPASVAGEVEIS